MADRSRAQGRLEVTIEVFVRVGLRRIGWQEHQLDLVRFVCQPFLDQGRVILHAQVVDHQEDFTLGFFDQHGECPGPDFSGHEFGVKSYLKKEL